MKNETKVLFLDLDGTLLNDNKEITPGNMAAIQKALSLGHKIVISSGRATVSALALAQKMGLMSEGCYAITFNGACIYDLYRQKSIYRKTLPLPTVRRLLDMANEFGIYAHTYASDRILTEHNTKELIFYSSSTVMKYEVVEDVCQALTCEPEKVIIIDFDDHQRLCDFKEFISEEIRGKADSFFSSPVYLEIVPRGVSKGAAIRTFCDYMNIPIENTVSAGDAENDITMLQATHISAVMKNADASMYSIGNYVTEHDNNHDAIAEIIYKFILKNGVDA
ncbi:MAG: Cof-type HAD-IIB family hydrolase [Eubacteriales bacterium]|nr:Cof-type HAD-IIB family hydrolase [Eubacteriales bacterium]